MAEDDMIYMMRTSDGREYLSSKDACAASGYSEEELRSLCLEGKVRSRWHRGAYFVERSSLLQQMRRGTFETHAPVDLSYSMALLHHRSLRRFSVLVGIVGIFILVLVLPLFFFHGTFSSRFDIAYAPSSYNSTAAFTGEGGTVAAAVTYADDRLAQGIEKAVLFIIGSFSDR